MKVTDFIKEAHNHKPGKVCTKCKKYRLLSEFYKNKNCKNGLHTQCKYCNKKYDDKKCRFRSWFIGVRSRARRTGKEFTIEPTDISGVKTKPVYYKDKKRRRVGRKTGVAGWEATEYPKVCSKWGIELDWGMNGVAHVNSPSLDRIESTKDYIPGNVRLVCQSYNMAKGNCPPDEWDVIEKNMARFVLFGNN